MLAKICLTTLSALLFLATPACVEGWCDEGEGWSDDCGRWTCSGEGCTDDGLGDDWTDDWDDWTDDWADTFCARSSDCPAGQVCHPESFCTEIVDGCPLRDECLGDPAGYTADWMGIDPLFIGSFSHPEADGRIELLIDFYQDHFYGEAYVLVEGPRIYRWLDVLVTGTRDGEVLWGQVVEADSPARTFDATFEARLQSGSVIFGDLAVSADEGDWTAGFALFRVSPCGCESEPTCSRHADCPAGQACREGVCSPVCFADGDCPPGQACSEDGRCG